jgi:hypothetical protein
MFKIQQLQLQVQLLPVVVRLGCSLFAVGATGPGNSSHMKTAHDVSCEDTCDECTCEHLWSRHLAWAFSWASKEKANWGIYLPSDRFRNTHSLQAMSMLTGQAMSMIINPPQDLSLGLVVWL